MHVLCNYIKPSNMHDYVHSVCLRQHYFLNHHFLALAPVVRAYRSSVSVQPSIRRFFDTVRVEFFKKNRTYQNRTYQPKQLKGYDLYFFKILQRPLVSIHNSSGFANAINTIKRHFNTQSCILSSQSKLLSTKARNI